MHLALSKKIDQAEQYYNQRAGSINNVREGKAIFWEILRSRTSLENKAMAVDRIGRLAVLEGELSDEVFGRSIRNADDIFEDCMKAADQINPHKVGQDTPEYYYWKATCMGLRAAHDPGYIMANLLNFSRDIMALISVGLQKYPEFDGGGFARLKASVYLNSKKAKVSGLYHPREALNLCEEAISINDEFMMAFYLKATALSYLKRKSEAKAFISEAITRFSRKIERDDFRKSPNGIENRVILQMMNDLKRKL